MFTRSWAKSLPGKNRDVRPTTKSSSLTASGWQWKTPWPPRRCMKKRVQATSELISSSRPGIMKWITREKVKVDRVACPWLIKKFVDPEAEFVFLPHDTDWASIRDGTVYDVPGCELGHHGEEVSFDAILRKHGLANDTALVLLAQI